VLGDFFIRGTHQIYMCYKPEACSRAVEARCYVKSLYSQWKTLYPLSYPAFHQSQTNSFQSNNFRCAGTISLNHLILWAARFGYGKKLSQSLIMGRFILYSLF